jgi:hypothetical protein
MVLSLCLLAVLRVLRANLYHLQVTPSTILWKAIKSWSHSPFIEERSALFLSHLLSLPYHSFASCPHSLNIQALGVAPGLVGLGTSGRQEDVHQPFIYRLLALLLAQLVETPQPQPPTQAVQQEVRPPEKPRTEAVQMSDTQ